MEFGAIVGGESASGALCQTGACSAYLSLLFSGYQRGEICGGITGQAEAVALAVSRALVKENEEVKPALKKFGLMTRDPRMVERKKFGQKKARKKFQFSKR